MTDAEFLAAFESCTLEDFPHRSHLRMAWLILRRDGVDRGTPRIIEGIQRFAAAKGATMKFHLTLTVFWIRAVDAALRAHPAGDFEGFLAANPDLTRADLTSRYYSRERLMSDAAREGWLSPDLAPMP